MKKLTTTTILMMIVFILSSLLAIECEAEDRIFRKLTTPQLLALTLYGEARGETPEGKLAVGTTILERQRRSRKSIKNIILEPSQFSCFLPEDKQYQRLKAIAISWNSNYRGNTLLRECYSLAKGLVEGTIVGHRVIMENSVTHFKTPVVKPLWSRQLRFVCQIGGHQFYSTTSVEVNYVGALNTYKRKAVKV